MESKKAKLIDRVEWWLPQAGDWGKWGDVSQRVKLPSIISSGDIMYSMVTRINNTVLYA